MNIPKYVNLLRKEMELKRYAENSIVNYESSLKKFLNYFDGIYTEPKKVPEEMIKNYLRESSSVSVLKQNIGCLKLFYKDVIRQPMKFKYIEYPRKEKKLPIPLSVGEIQKLFNVCTNLKHKAILSVMYGAGLRISEVLNLKVNYTSTKDECASGGHCLSQPKRLPPVFVLSARQSLPHTNILNMQNLVIVMQMLFTCMVLRFRRFTKTTLLPFQRTIANIQKNI